MASSSGNSYGTSSSSEILAMEEERKRKRMESNRESARRSRMRKQKHLDELLAQANDLRRQNERLSAGVNVVVGHVAVVEAENSVLRAQMSELGHRLSSLNEIVGVIAGGDGFAMDHSLGRFVTPYNNIASADLVFY